jgi:hypothetical protein
MNDDEKTRLDAFLAVLPSAWVPVAAAFTRSSGIVDAHVDPDGSWTLDLTFGLTPVGTLLRHAPVKFSSVASGQDWWLDQHLESEGGVAVASEARAIVTWSDDFAAGLNATLRVFASRAAYDAAVFEALG